MIHEILILIGNSARCKKAAQEIAGSLSEDLFQEAIINITEIDTAKLERLLLDNSIEQYFCGMMYRMYNLPKSDFFKTYRTTTDQLFDLAEPQEEALPDVDSILEEMLTSSNIHYWFSAKLLMETKKYSILQISKKTKIHRRAITDAVNFAKEYIRKKSNEH